MSKETRERGEMKREKIRKGIHDLIKISLEEGLDIFETKKRIFSNIEALKKNNPQESSLVTGVMIEFKNLHGLILDTQKKLHKETKNEITKAQDNK